MYLMSPSGMRNGIHNRSAARRAVHGQVAALRHADPNHKQGGDGKKREPQSALNPEGHRMHRRNEEVFKSQNRESDCKQTRAEAAKPGCQKDCAEKQRYERRAPEKRSTSSPATTAAATASTAAT